MFESLKRQVGRPGKRRAIRRRIYDYRHAVGSAIGGTRGGPQGDFASRIVWVFGAGRTGSTWLAHMVSDLESCRMWNEPYIGHMFGHLYYEIADRRHDSIHFVMGGEKRKWMPQVREFILGTAAAKFPEAAKRPSLNLVIKEPHGSVGAPLVMEALPESRMVLLIREPRDAVASRLDARRPGGWSKKKSRYQKAEGDESAVVRSLSKSFMREMSRSVEAYHVHKGPKTLVTYEELRADPARTMKRLCSEVGLHVRAGELERITESHAWENVPEDEKGQGKFKRKATPGGWREDLTAEQVSVIEEITGSFMDEFGYERLAASN